MKTKHGVIERKGIGRMLYEVWTNGAFVWRFSDKTTADKLFHDRTHGIFKMASMDYNHVDSSTENACK